VRRSFQLSTGHTAALDTHATDPDGAAALPSVLFVPGYTGSKEDFLPLLRPLASAGFRAVAVDQRGQYESEWARSPGGYLIDSLAADICELARQLRAPSGPVLHLVGHSWGGLVTRAAVLAEPNLFDSFTLMGSGPAAIGGERRAILDTSEPVLLEHGMEVLWEQIAERSQADPKWVQSPPAVKTFLRTRFLANDPEGLRIMGRQLRTAADRTAELAATGISVLVLHGVDDDAWPPPVQRVMAQELGAATVVVDEAAHSPAVENPAATLQELLAFWRSVTRVAG